MDLQTGKGKEESIGADHLKFSNIVKHTCENINLHIQMQKNRWVRIMIIHCFIYILKKSILLSLKEFPWVDLGSLEHIINESKEEQVYTGRLHSVQQSLGGPGEPPCASRLLKQLIEGTTSSDGFLPTANLGLVVWESNSFPLKRRRLKFPEYFASCQQRLTYIFTPYEVTVRLKKPSIK